MVSEDEVAVRVLLERVLAGELGLDEAVTEVNKVTTSGRPVSRVERRQWKRKEFSAQGTLSIVYGLDQRRVSHAEKILVANISMGGVKIQAPFLSLDGLHIVGELGAEVWMPNVLSLEVTLPTIFPAKIGFQGGAEWYLRLGAEPYYLMGISINIISMEHKDLLFSFIQQEGSNS